MAMGVALAATSSAASPYGTSYTASVVNFPGSASASMLFDGLAAPLGNSGLIVNEKSTSFGAFELLEFSVRTADGEPFIGQQSAPTESSSVQISGLHWLDDPSDATALARSAFLWLAIDGVPQALSDPAGLGLVFGAHPLDPSIQIVYIRNIQTAQLDFGTLGSTAFEAFAALTGPFLALEIDDVHFGVAAAPVPEPGVSMLLLGGCMGLVGLDRWRARSARRR